MIVHKDQSKEIGDKPSIPKTAEVTKWKSIFGKYDDSEMVSILQKLALDPCDSKVTKDSDRPLWNQILRVRKVMTLTATESGPRKRKLEQFVKENCRGASGSAFKLPCKQKANKKPKGRSSQSSEISCLVNQSNHAATIEHKQSTDTNCSGSITTTESTLQEQGRHSMECCSSIPNSQIIDLNKLPTGPSPRIHASSESPSVGSSKSLQEPSSRTLEEPKESHGNSPRRSIRIRNFIGDRFQTLTIPVGPAFQADVPDWTGPNGVGYIHSKDYDDESQKWLGTRVWPIEDQCVAITGRAIGKGRTESCSCPSPGSGDCIRLHTNEERTMLQSEIGSAFYDWKFDEMGQNVALAWTHEEQEKFEVLMKKSSKNLLKHAFECFPLMSKKSILSYYLNVLMHRDKNSEKSLFLKMRSSGR